MMILRRSVQIISLGCFLALLWFAAFPLILPVPVDLFLRMDPLVFLTTLITTRSVIPALVLAAGIIGLTFIFGRFFCSMVCPLGTTIDVTDKITRRLPFSLRLRPGPMRFTKYFLLCFAVGAALLGVSLDFLLAPIPLATRLYGLLVYPMVALAADAGLNIIRPLAERIGAENIVYANFLHPSFSLRWLTLGMTGGIVACGILAPRFWCRYLCPAGAIFSFASMHPLWGRRVSGDCTSCGLCRRKCPTDAVKKDPRETDYSECILCRSCAEVCPADAVSFSFAGRAKKQGSGFSANRRAIIISGMSGMAAALFTISGMKVFAHETSRIRPPGASPEHEFLARCIGCGECMKACPTNTLQPAGLAADFGILSPVITPRIGPCDPACTACGQVCPTRAIRPLVPDEKRYAKIGTAGINRKKCIAWEKGQSCLVCAEVCPYGAVDLKRVEDVSVDVPFVAENRCNGCGFCENYCPVTGRAAIEVEPKGALRLEKGSYRQKSGDLGLSIEPKADQKPEKGELPPGFTN